MLLVQQVGKGGYIMGDRFLVENDKDPEDFFEYEKRTWETAFAVGACVIIFIVFLLWITA